MVTITSITSVYTMNQYLVQVNADKLSFKLRSTDNYVKSQKLIEVL